jgi:hypothetical protein
VIALPDGVHSIDSIEDAGPLAHLTKEIDLDDLMLALAAEYLRNGYIDMRRDEVTSIPGYDGTGATVGWFRKAFCNCGEEHNWDLMHLGDEKPEGNKARGAFLGVWFA